MSMFGRMPWNPAAAARMRSWISQYPKSSGTTQTRLSSGRNLGIAPSNGTVPSPVRRAIEGVGVVPAIVPAGGAEREIGRSPDHVDLELNAGLGVDADDAEPRAGVEPVRCEIEPVDPGAVAARRRQERFEEPARLLVAAGPGEPVQADVLLQRIDDARLPEGRIEKGRSR